MGHLSTHVLDTAHGCPAEGMHVLLQREVDGAWIAVKSSDLNADGRTNGPLLVSHEMFAGLYRLSFSVADYFRDRGVNLPDPAFLGTVNIDFGIADSEGHYHVPLLCSPWSYSTYRGS